MIEPGLCEQMLGFFVKEPSKLHGVKDTPCALSVPPPRVTKPLGFLAATWEKGVGGRVKVRVCVCV